jgi:DNA invertase Pin-like site-specific DNA recombinase
MAAITRFSPEARNCCASAPRSAIRPWDLLSLEEKINTASAAGELVFHVFGAIAHFERRLIAERRKDGIAAARARGKRPGRHPLDADKITAALKLVQAGLSPTAAARQVGLGRSTGYRKLGRAGSERHLPSAS